MKLALLTLSTLLLTLGILSAEITPVKPSEASAQLEKQPEIIIVDLRTPEEFAEGHLKGAINLNFNAEDFEKQLAKLDPTKTYLTHCRSGGRSKASIPTWEKLKFKKVLHLDTGIIGWTEAGLKLVKEEKKSDQEPNAADQA